MIRNYITGIKLKSLPEPKSYLASLPAIKYLASVERLPFSQPVTFLAGENGAGKSTLLEAIALCCGFNPEGGSRDFAFSTQDSHSELYRFLAVIKSRPPADGFFLRAESFYNTASFLDQNSQETRTTLNRYGGVSFHAQSHGEAFLSLVTNRFDGKGLYLLDEPEAALSPQGIMSLICAIDSLVKQDSQFLIATHSPILMAYPKAQILEINESGIGPVDFRETQHYQITKLFLDDPDRMIRYLLD